MSFRKCLDKGVVRTLLDGELSKTSEFGRTLDKHLLKLAPLISTKQQTGNPKHTKQKVS